LGDLFLAAQGSNTPVKRKPQRLVWDVGCRNLAGQRQVHVDLQRGPFSPGFLGIGRFRGQTSCHPLLAHGLGQQAGVELKTDRLDVSALTRAQEVARAAHLQVAHGDGISGAELAVIGQHFQAFLAFRGGVEACVVEEISKGTLGAAPNPPAQLVKLCQAKGIGSVDDQGVGVGNIQAGLDDGGTEQDINLVMVEGMHHLGQLALVDLPMRDADPGFRHQLGKVVVHRRDGLHAVVNVKNLAAAVQFPNDRLAYQFGVVRPHVRDHRQAFLRRGVDGGDIAHAGERHIQRPRDGSCRKRKHIHLGAQFFEVLLMRHAKALFFVDDHQA